MKNPGTESALPLRFRVFARPNGSGKSNLLGDPHGAQLTGKLIAHFKRMGDAEKWDDIASEDISEWFKKYYR